MIRQPTGYGAMTAVHRIVGVSSPCYGSCEIAQKSYDEAWDFSLSTKPLTMSNVLPPHHRCGARTRLCAQR